MTDARLLRRTCELNARLYLAALSEVDDEVALRRTGEANHIAFLACHLIDARHYLAGLLGLELENPLAYMAEARRIEDVERFPSLDELRGAWREVSEKLAERLGSIGDEALDGEVPHRFPIEGGGRVRGGAAFLLDHEAFHIGQIALLRRLHGLPALRWD